MCWCWFWALTGITPLVNQDQDIPPINPRNRFHLVSCSIPTTPPAPPADSLCSKLAALCCLAAACFPFQLGTSTSSLFSIDWLATPCLYCHLLTKTSIVSKPQMRKRDNFALLQPENVVRLSCKSGHSGVKIWLSWFWRATPPPPPPSAPPTPTWAPALLQAQWLWLRAGGGWDGATLSVVTCESLLRSGGEWMRNTQTALEPRLQQHCDSLTKHIPTLSCELSWGSLLEADLPLPGAMQRTTHFIAAVVFLCHHGDTDSRQIFSIVSLVSIVSLARQRRQISCDSPTFRWVETVQIIMEALWLII